MKVHTVISFNDLDDKRFLESKLPIFKTASNQVELKKLLIEEVIFILVDALVFKAASLASDYNYKFEVFNGQDFLLEDYDLYQRSFLEGEFFVVADVHGCIGELKQLLLSNNFLIENDKIITSKKIILLGDFIDKASFEDITETIEFLHLNIDKFVFVRGNHEEMVWRWLVDDISLDKSEVRLRERDMFYKTYSLLVDNELLRQKFFEIYELSLFFAVFKNYILTHAPCEKKHLGRLNKLARKRQVCSTSRSSNSKTSLDDLYLYLIEEASDTDLIHIFGHLGQSEIRRFKNKICVDSGCVYDNRLTGFDFSEFSFVPSSGERVKVHQTKKLFSNVGDR